MIRVLIADDQALVRGAISALLNLEEDIEVLAQVGRGDEVAPAVQRTPIDVAVLDVEMPGADGIEAAAGLKASGFTGAILMVTTFGRPGFVRRAMEAGADGFVVKDTPAEQLAEAIRKVAKGLKVIDPQLAAESFTTGFNPLSAREIEILNAARDGSTTAEIGAALHLSEGTIRNYLSSAIGKVGARTRAEAVATADANGWL